MIVSPLLSSPLYKVNLTMDDLDKIRHHCLHQSVCLSARLFVYLNRTQRNGVVGRKYNMCQETPAMKRFLSWNDSCHETVLIMKRFLSQSNHHILWGSDSPLCNSTWSDSIGSRCTEGIFPEYVPYCTLVVQYLHSWLILIYFLK